MRYSEKHRKTNETDITVKLNIDGEGNSEVNTGIGFFDHMLQAMAFHAKFDLTVLAKGDLHVDDHHTVEDTGILIGKALLETILDSPIARYGNAFIPMDEALAFCALDISGRSIFVFHDRALSQMPSKDFDMVLISEFFMALTRTAGLTLHMKVEYGSNAHHIAEALFKAFGKAIMLALKPSANVESSKGVLDLSEHNI